MTSYFPSSANERPNPAYAAQERFSGTAETEYGMPSMIGPGGQFTATTSYRQDTASKELVLRGIVTTGMAITRTSGVEVICPPFELPPNGTRRLRGSMTTYTSDPPQRLPENGTVRLQERAEAAWELTTGVFGTGVQMSGEYVGTPEGAQELLHWRNSILMSFVNGFNKERIRSIVQQAYANAYIPDPNQGVNPANNMAQLLSEERNLYGIAGTDTHSLATRIANMGRKNPDLDTLLVSDDFAEMMRERTTTMVVPHVQMCVDSGFMSGRYVRDPDNPDMLKEFQGHAIADRYLMVTAPTITNRQAQTQQQFLSSRFVIGEVYAPEANIRYDESNRKTASMKDYEMAIYDEPDDSRKVLHGQEMFEECRVWDRSAEEEQLNRSARENHMFMAPPTHGFDVETDDHLLYDAHLVKFTEEIRNGNEKLSDVHTVHGVPPMFPQCFTRNSSHMGDRIEARSAYLPVLAGSLDESQMTDEHFEESLFVASNALSEVGDLADVERLRKDIENTPYDNDSFVKLARLNAMRSVAYDDGNYTFKGVVTPEHRVATPGMNGGGCKRMKEWKPNKMGGFDIDADTKPLGMFSAAGLRSLSQSNHPLSSRADNALSKLERLTNLIEKKFTKRNFAIDGRLTSPAFHTESGVQQLMDVIWGQRRPLFMADPSGVLSKGQYDRKKRSSLRKTVNGRTVTLVRDSPVASRDNREENKVTVLVRGNVALAVDSNLAVSSDTNTLMARMEDIDWVDKVRGKYNEFDPGEKQIIDDMVRKLVYVANLDPEDRSDEDVTDLKRIIGMFKNTNPEDVVGIPERYDDASDSGADVPEPPRFGQAIEDVRRETSVLKTVGNSKLQRATEGIEEIYRILDKYSDEDTRYSPLKFANVDESIQIDEDGSVTNINIDGDDRDRIKKILGGISGLDVVPNEEASRYDYPSGRSVYYRTPLVATAAILEGASVEARPWVHPGDGSMHDNTYVDIKDDNLYDGVMENISVQATDPSVNYTKLLDHSYELSVYGLIVRFGDEVLRRRALADPLLNRLRRMRYANSSNPTAIAAGVAFLMTEFHRLSVVTHAVTNGILMPLELTPWRLGMAHMMDSAVMTQRNGKSCFLAYSPGKIIPAVDGHTDNVHFRASMPYDVAIVQPGNFYLIRAIRPRQYLGGCNSRIVHDPEELTAPDEELRPSVIVTCNRRGYMATRQYPIAFDNNPMAMIDTGATSGAALDPDIRRQGWPGGQYYMWVYGEWILGNSSLNYQDLAVNRYEDLPPFTNSGDDTKNLVAFRGEHNLYSRATDEFTRNVQGNGHRKMGMNQKGAREYMNGEKNMLESYASQQDMVPVR